MYNLRLTQPNEEKLGARSAPIIALVINIITITGMAVTALRVTSRNESPPYVTGFSAVTLCIPYPRYNNASRLARAVSKLRAGCVHSLSTVELIKKQRKPRDGLLSSPLFLP